MTYEKLERMQERYREIEREMAEPDAAADRNRLQALGKEYAALQPAVTKYGEYQDTEREVSELRALLEQTTDSAMRQVVREELASLTSRLEELEEGLKELNESRFASDLAGLIATEKKLLERQKEKEAADARAKAEADARAAADAERRAREKRFADLKAGVRASRDHAANIKALEDGMKEFTAPRKSAELAKLLGVEKRSLADQKAAEAEAAARKTYDDARGLVKTARDHAATIGALEEAAGKLKGTRYEGKLAPVIAAEKKLLARQKAREAADAKAKAAADALYNRLTRMV